MLGIILVSLLQNLLHKTLFQLHVRKKVELHFKEGERKEMCFLQVMVMSYLELI